MTVATASTQPAQPSPRRERLWPVVLTIFAITAGLFAIVMGEEMIRAHYYSRDLKIVPVQSDQNIGALLTGGCGADFLFVGPDKWWLHFENRTDQKLTGIKIIADGKQLAATTNLSSSDYGVDSLDAGEKLFVYRNHDTQTPGAPVAPPRQFRVKTDQGTYEWVIQ